MPDTYTSLNYHICFSTQGRGPWLDERWRQELWGYMGGTVRGLKGVGLAVGGWSDHVHLLVGLRPDHRISDVVRELKKASTTYIQQHFGKAGFHWQEGYYAFSVSSDDISKVRAYIEGQEEHHGTQRPGFMEELAKLLEENKVPYDPRYLK